jgi:hypothetical protein
MTCVSVLSSFERLIFHLDLNTCHPSDWAMCLLLVFFHVASDPTVQRLGTPEELGQELLSMKHPEAPKSRVNPCRPSRGDMWW